MHDGFFRLKEIMTLVLRVKELDLLHVRNGDASVIHVKRDHSHAIPQVIQILRVHHLALDQQTLGSLLNLRIQRRVCIPQLLPNST